MGSCHPRLPRAMRHTTGTTFVWSSREQPSFQAVCPSAIRPRSPSKSGRTASTAPRRFARPRGHRRADPGEIAARSESGGGGALRPPRAESPPSHRGGSRARLEIAPHPDRFKGRRQLLTVRVLDRDGARKIAQRQVLILATPADAAAGSEATPALVFSGRTDAKGYVSGPYPRGRFAEAFAEVARVRTPLRLEDDGSLAAAGRVRDDPAGR